jgi:hypothetical protein
MLNLCVRYNIFHQHFYWLITRPGMLASIAELIGKFNICMKTAFCRLFSVTNTTLTTNFDLASRNMSIEDVTTEICRGRETLSLMQM